MWRRFITTRLIVDTSYVLHETTGVLSDPVCGAAMFMSGHTSRRIALWRTRAMSLRSELVNPPPELMSETNIAMMYGGKG